MIRIIAATDILTAIPIAGPLFLAWFWVGAAEGVELEVELKDAVADADDERVINDTGEPSSDPMENRLMESFPGQQLCGR